MTLVIIELDQKLFVILNLELLPKSVFQLRKVLKLSVEELSLQLPRGKRDQEVDSLSVRHSVALIFLLDVGKRLLEVRVELVLVLQIALDDLLLNLLQLLHFHELLLGEVDVVILHFHNQLLYHRILD